MKKLLILLTLILSVDSFALSLKLPYQEEVFTATSSTETTAWYDIRYSTFIGFTIVASAGAGVVTVQYSNERDQPAASIFDDANTGAYTTAAPTNLYANGISQHWARATVTCTSAPCTYTMRFTAKGLK